MKYCPNCGKEIVAGASFCDNCGAKLGGENQASYSNYSTPILPNRNIAISVILSLVTCGIYNIYWFIMMTDESNSISDEEYSSGAMSLLFTIITCGIYAIYWNYQMGRKLAEAGKKYNLAIADNSILYLLLSIFGLGIVSNCLIQSDLNRFSAS